MNSLTFWTSNFFHTLLIYLKNPFKSLIYKNKNILNMKFLFNTIMDVIITVTYLKILGENRVD